MNRMLIAVDDSIASLAAARYAFPLAIGWRSTVRLLTAIGDETGRGAAEKLLEHVTREAHAAGLDEAHVEATVAVGEAFTCILHEAQAWKAELVVMAVSHRDTLRSPYVGSQTEHVLEFTECPVLVVPHD